MALRTGGRIFLSVRVSLIDLIFDATDIGQSPFLVYAVEYDCSFFSILKSFSVGPGVTFNERPEWKILE